MNKSVHAPRLVYGKLLQHEAGPVLPSFEHTVTGVSPGISDSVRQHLHPSVIGLRTGRLFIWDDYPWLKEGGGIVIWPLTEDGGRQVVAARVRPHREGGEQTLTRFFIQALYLVLQAEDWTPFLLPALDQAMAVAPMLSYDHDLAPATLQPVPETPLPPDWLEQAAPLLADLMSGKNAGIASSEIPVRQGLTLLATVMACLPPRSWPLMPLGVGVGDGSDFALSVSLQGIGAAHPCDADGQAGLEQPCQAGRAFVRHLRNTLAQADVRPSTLSELVALMGKTYGPAPVADTEERDWRRVLTDCSTRIHEHLILAGLQEWLAGKGPCPSDLDTLNLLRRDALEKVVTATLAGNAQALSLLPELCLEHWRPAWKDLLATGTRPEAPVRTLAGLLGLARLDSLQGVEALRQQRLPDESRERVRQTLDERLASSRNPDEWVGLATPDARDASWLKSWRETAEGPLLLLGLEQVSVGAASKLWDALSWAGRHAVWSRFRQGVFQEIQPLRDLLDSLADRKDARTCQSIADKALEHGAVLAYFLALEALQATGAHQALPPFDTMDQGRLSDLCQSLVRDLLSSRLASRSPFSRTMVRALLALRCRYGDDFDSIFSKHAELFKQFATSLGASSARVIFLEEGIPSAAPFVEEGLKAVGQLLESDTRGEYAATLLECILSSGAAGDAGRSRESELFTRWASRANIAIAERTDQKMRFAILLGKGSSISAASQRGDLDALTARRIIEALGMDGSTFLLRCTMETKADLRWIVEALPEVGPPVDLRGPDVALLLQAALSGADELAEWRKLIGEKRLVMSQSAGCRLLSSPPEIRREMILMPEESNALATLPLASLQLALKEEIPLPTEALVTLVKALDTDDCILDLRTLRVLVSQALASRDTEVVKRLAVKTYFQLDAAQQALVKKVHLSSPVGKMLNGLRQQVMGFFTHPDRRERLEHHLVIELLKALPRQDRDDVFCPPRRGGWNTRRGR